MELEIFKSSYGYYNLRTNGARPTEEMVSYLKENGYRWSRNNNCWYPATSDAKEKNLHDDFVMKFQERFFDNGTKEQIEDRNVSEQIENDVVSEKITQLEEKQVQLQSLIDELLAERKRDKEKIAQLEFEVANSRASDEQEAFFTQQEQQQLDEESEWERENSLTADEEAAIVAESHAEEEPAAEKHFLQAQEHPERTAQPESDSVEVSPEELSGAKRMLPTAQYVTTLRFSQGEEGDFFKRQIKDIAAAVKNAPKIGETDGMEQHPIVFRYFHPTGTETLVTEIGEDGEVYGFQCLNGDYEMAEWGYLNLNEIKNIPGMEMDYHVPEGMTVERWLYQEKPDQFPQYAKFAENETAQSEKHTQEQQNEITCRIIEKGSVVTYQEFDATNKSELYTKIAMYFEREKYNSGVKRSFENEKIGEEFYKWRSANWDLLFPRNGYHQITHDFGKVTSENDLYFKPIQNTEQPSVSKSDIKRIREQCREILKKPDSEITEEDKKILSQYEGAGGINEEKRSNAGILNEFYTPNNLVEKVWQIVDAYVPAAKTVLEPSAGVGKFANNRANNEFTMHELDETSARINRILHSEANVIQGAYQKQFFDDGERFKKIDFEQPKYDVVIGNPPYGTYNDKYKGLGEGKEFDRYEEYFIAKGLDALKDENSVLAFVVPSGFLNTASDKQKEIIASKGRLIDAYRLPVGTFPTTEVGTDIIIMRSWEKDRKTIMENGKGNAAYKQASLDEAIELISDNISNGQWFKQHPEKILGEVKTRTNRFGKEEEYVAVHEGLTVQDELNKIDGMLPKVDQEKPELKTYHTLKEEDVRNLEIISDEEFEDIVDSIILNDYKNIPNSVRLPNLNEQLAEKLGLEKNSAFILKKNATHIRPDRKGSYNQALSTEEYYSIPSVIRTANFVVVDKRTKNFQIVFADNDDSSKINKLVFNKDELGNYLVTVGKVDRRDSLSEENNIVVAVGVAPTISALRFPEELPATRLRPSTTTVDSNISQQTEKSSHIQNNDRQMSAEVAANKKSLQEEIYDRYIAADISPAFSDREGYARKISQEIASALETKRSIDIGTIRTHLSMKNDHVSFEEKKLVKAIFEEKTGLKLPEFVNDYEAFDTQMNQVIDSWAKNSRKQDKLQTKAIRTIRGFYNGDSAFEARLDHIADVIRDADMTSTDSVVMVRMIADFDTHSSHYENQKTYETAVSDVISQFEKMESVFAQNIPLQEAQPEKAKSSRPKKEKWNIVKSKGEVMTAQEFSRLYGKDFDEREFPIWAATDWQGNIDLSKLSAEDMRYLHESGNYVQKNLDEWTHKVLFTSGDIYAKIEEQKKLRDDAIDRHGENADSAKTFAENIALLESVRKPLLDMEHIHLGVKTTLAEEFTTTHLDSDGNLVELNLQESFILWAQNATLAMGMWRGDIDFATANISREELGEELSFRDIVAYIDGEPVKAEAVRGWRTYSMSEEEKAAEKAERKKEADLKRQERSDTANRLFDRYLHEGLDDATRTRLVAEYNRRFNSYIIPDYSKLPLFVDGMSAYKGESKFKLYDQQIKGISFLCNKGNGLLAYDVGVGKTAAGIVATVNQIQTGRSRRPFIVVPNQVYAKWYTDIKQLFPNMQVNDLYNFNKDSVGKFVNKKNPHKLNIPENTISLCTYEALKNITFTDRSCENELFEDFASLLSADFDGSERENAESADKIKGIIGSASHVKDASYYFFEDCGFDNLTVDEAHNFKNLWVVPRPKKKGQSNEYAGIPSGKPSARALKMYGMTQLVQRYNDDRNVFMLTATPFTNSPTEVYSMLSYIGRERLRKAGISSLRSFFDQFAQTKQELGVTSTGSVDTKQVMKSWKELPALQAILTEFIDKVDGEEAGIIRPNKFTHVKPLDMSALQKAMRDIDEERMAEVKAGNSAAVIVAMNNMRLACVAPALANPAMYPGIKLPPLTELVETSPKLKFVCDAIIDMYKGNHEKGQFMYVPLGKESHGIIKDYLVRHGIPKEAVEIINGEINNTPEKKEKITSRFNDEKHPLKIIIGGKNTCEGIDLNGNSFVMYNCSLGWNPSETIQAEGRIWRQGNLQGNVHIVYPVMNDSIDSVLYQKHDEKRSRINELWNYKGDSLNVEDINSFFRKRQKRRGRNSHGSP